MIEGNNSVLDNEDILNNVFSYSKESNEFYAVSLVCHDWRQAIKPKELDFMISDKNVFFFAPGDYPVLTAAKADSIVKKYLNVKETEVDQGKFLKSYSNLEVALGEVNAEFLETSLEFRQHLLNCLKFSFELWLQSLDKMFSLYPVRLVNFFVTPLLNQLDTLARPLMVVKLRKNLREKVNENQISKQDIAWVHGLFYHNPQTNEKEFKKAMPSSIKVNEKPLTDNEARGRKPYYYNSYGSF